MGEFEECRHHVTHNNLKKGEMTGELDGIAVLAGDRKGMEIREQRRLRIDGRI